MRLNACRKLLQTRIIIPNNKYQCSNQKNNQYPYRFGGLSSAQYNPKKLAKQFHTLMLTDQIENTFIKTYRQYLHALENKDMEFLNKKVEPALFKNNNINSKVKIINEDAPVHASVEDNLLIGNIGFTRSKNNLEMILKKLPDYYKQSFQYFQGITSSNNINNGEDIKTLFVTRVYFKSAMKLVKIGQKDQAQARNVKQQVHMVQLEVENNAKASDLFNQRVKSKIRYIFNREKHRLNVMKIMIGGSPSSDWKIGDIDRILKGNLPKIGLEPASGEQPKK